VDSRGIIKQEDLARALDIKTDLVSIQWVNNETGVIQDIPSFSLMAHNAGALFHTDAVQAVGKLPIDLQRIPIDFLSLTGHKLHAPQGVGALFVRQKKALIPLLIGGDQEHKLRAGTENILGIAALGFAIEDRMLDFDAKISYLRSMRDLFEHIVLNGDNKIIINGTTESRVVNTSNLRFSGIDGRPLIALLDQEGVVCSQSSACTSSIPEPSHVLMAMGLSEDESYSSIRFSFSVENSLKEAEEAAKIVLATLRRLRATYKAYLN
jgi:cysteine desulfurase